MTSGHSARGVGDRSPAVDPAAPSGADGLTPDELADQWEAEKPPSAGAIANLGAAAVVIALGVTGIIGSLSLGLGSVQSPAPGTWPLIISLVLVTLGVTLALTAWRMTDAEKFSGSSWLVLAGLASMAAFAALIDTIGFEIPAILLAFVWLKFLGRESWRSSIIGSLLMVAAFYLLFVLALSVSIPHLI